MHFTTVCAFFLVIIIGVSNVNANLSHVQAAHLLSAAGIPIWSSGKCIDRKNPECTSLEGVRHQTIDGITAFKRASKCHVTVTGGTEVGHEIPSPYSHANGYKLDISKRDGEPCLSNYIKHHFAH